jgi:FtsH-binding integral membrane protein
MMSESNPYRAIGAVSEAAATDRAAFIRRTYVHLAGAVAVFAGLEAALLSQPWVETMVRSMTSGYAWLAVMAAFIGVAYLAENMARTVTSLSKQYLGLGLYIVAEAVIFVPILFIASRFYDGILLNAGVITVLMFGIMTCFVYTTGADFSFLRGALFMATIGALVLIVASFIFGFTLGLGFSVLMVAVACMWVLYDTSKVMLHYRTDQHVVASLALFASVALLFWYVVRVLMALQRR